MTIQQLTLYLVIFILIILCLYGSKANAYETLGGMSMRAAEQQCIQAGGILTVVSTSHPATYDFTAGPYAPVIIQQPGYNQPQYVRCKSIHTSDILWTVSIGE